MTLVAAPAMSRRARRILWVDGGAGLIVGVVVLALHGWLAGLYGLPSEWVLAIGVANVVYGSSSGTLATRAARGRGPSRRAIDLLVAANLAWGVVCAALVVVARDRATGIGLGVLAFEGVFVAALAVIERRLVRPEAR